MDVPYPLTCTVIRVTRPDTLMIRTHVPQMQASVTMYIALVGVKCGDAAKQDIIDWVELHADFGRLRLLALDWYRDSYGRVIADLADTQTGDCLTSYLLQQGTAEPYDNHLIDTLREMMSAEEPDAEW